MVSPIFNLPDEILAIILDFASLKSPRVDFDNEIRLYSSTRKLVFVCRRFHRLVLPIMYRTIVFGLGPMITSGESFMLFHRTMRENPALRPLCRRLDIQLEWFSLINKEKYQHWGDLFAWMTRLHTLKFAVDLRPGQFSGLVPLADDLHNSLAWNLIRSAGQHMPELAYFQIQGLFCRMNLRDVVKHAPLTSLKVLRVVKAGEIESGATGVESKDYQTAPFNTLDLVDTRASSDTIAQLIQWPKELVCFSLQQSHIYGADLPMLCSWLSGHRDTLKKIEIGSFSARGVGTLFNAARFPNLETLLLARRMMGSPQGDLARPYLEWSPDHADLLLGPKLHSFTWLFEEDNVNRLEWHEFGDQEESWLRNLMKEAVARKSALRKIRIEFSPDMESAEPQEYPWNRMDCLHEEFEPYGLTLEYCDPPVTKSEWQVMFDESFDPFDVSSESSDMEE